VKTLAGGCRVFGPEDGAVSVRGIWTSRTVMSRSTGAPLITQTINDYAPGVSPTTLNPHGEEVHYITAGAGVCHVNGFPYDVRPGAAIFVPPGAVYSVENRGPDTVRIISACCPEDPDRRILDRQPVAGSGEPPRLLVHEEEREAMRAGRDRVFRILVNTDVGCQQVTQFVGWIPPSKAPFHRHTYEEGICVLEGHGILHLQGQPSASEFGPGTGIYFPVGVVHCLENPGPSPIRLLGVFHPSGSPGAAYEDT
jgi:mannose-6-phosphate isomerase-like protein (cupin superfamily)